MNKNEAEQIIKKANETLEDCKKAIINNEKTIATLEKLKADAEKELEKDDEVPECYNIEHGSEMYFVDYNGEVYSDGFFSNNLADETANEKHRAFKTEKIAKLFEEKTQVIADQLYFKELYDPDYEPDWSDTENDKSYLFFSTQSNTYKVAGGTITKHSGAVYFSSYEIAQKCADWLNSRKTK